MKEMFDHVTQCQVIISESYDILLFPLQIISGQQLVLKNYINTNIFIVGLILILFIGVIYSSLRTYHLFPQGFDLYLESV